MRLAKEIRLSFTPPFRRRRKKNYAALILARLADLATSKKYGGETPLDDYFSEEPSF